MALIWAACAGARISPQLSGVTKKEKLLIELTLKVRGKAVGPYFDETPLKDSLGATLQELQLDGDVNARLHLDIPLNGELVPAKGEVNAAK